LRCRPRHLGPPATSLCEHSRRSRGGRRESRLQSLLHGDYNALVRAVQQGLVTEKDIDQALYYTLWIRFRLGMFDPADKVPYSKYTIKDNDTDAHRQVALELARQSLVLLKNDGIIPLNRSKYKRIAVIGPNSNSKTMLEGNYHGSSSRPVSILAGIKELAGTEIQVTFAQGAPNTTNRQTAAWSGQDNTTTRPIAQLYAEALGQATNADLIIYVGGITAAQEGDTIVVDPGIYESGHPVEDVNGVRFALVLNKAVTVTSRKPDDPTVVAATIIRGPGTVGGNQLNNQGILFRKDTTRQTVFNGFTLENFGASVINGGAGGNRANGHPNGYDGAPVNGSAMILLRGASPTVKNCIIRNNSVTGGNGGAGAGADATHNAGRGGWAGWARGLRCSAWMKLASWPRAWTGWRMTCKMRSSPPCSALARAT
jgi:hypothetical protein